MIIEELLDRRDMTKYRLAVQAGVPHATLNDICSGKTRLEKCSAETVYILAKPQVVLRISENTRNGLFLFPCIPYRRAVKEQMLDGKLTEPVNDRKFNDKFKAIVDKIVG